MAASGFNTPIAPKKRAARKSDGSDPAYGMPAPGAHPETPGKCKTPHCGARQSAVHETDLQDGWVRTSVYGSTDPERVWCSGLCAQRGILLAELRVGEVAGA
ncbi:hypothetical protein ACFW9O_25150 [Streptomyces sp. NPDC059499]|uniref:hypothetical protein n=1 Tax=Streptomyces sp. NPDC059499 TaxID=3346852 RepID=UPI0036901CB2